MDKWRLQADSAHQTGLDTTLEEVLTVVQSGGGGVDNITRNLRKSTPTFIAAQQPEAL
jgi:hypothetical protein